MCFADKLRIMNKVSTSFVAPRSDVPTSKEYLLLKNTDDDFFCNCIMFIDCMMCFIKNLFKFFA